MKRLKETPNEHHWPRKAVASVECRKRDLVIRIADWTRESLSTGEPGYDVEVYVGGIYDWKLSKSCTVHMLGSKTAAKRCAIEYAREQVAKLL